MSDDQNTVHPETEITVSEINRNDVSYAIENLMHNAYLQYSVSANVGRAIPDVRDGMKPGNRRILFAMRQRGFGKSGPYAKCAKVVGEVIGNYHPHGDLAVYNTLVRMAQDFSMRCPLIDGQGNFGSIDGDSAAAYRYTECRMERLAEELMMDLDKDTVNMRPTFDEKDLEPSVLPARFPNLLVNGTQGIGVGMATNIPPHNLGEVIDGTIALIDNPRISVRELMRHIPGPDLPTGGSIQGLRSIITLYETGHSSLRMRGKASIEEKNGKETIVITEIPYMVNKENMVLKMAELVTDGRIQGIASIEDLSSSRVGIRIHIEIKRGFMPNVILNQLYALSPLQSTLPAQFLVVDRNRPRTMNLKQILEAYIDHREEVITRRCRFELRKAEERKHILDGLFIAQANIDEVVHIIRAAANRDEAAHRLQERFALSERQTKAILEMRLYQLTNLAVDELKAEYDALVAEIDRLKTILSSRANIMEVVKTELLEVRNKYADPRRTQIVPGESDISLEDLLAREICVIPISATGYIKRVRADLYEAQNRGGKGVRGMKTKEEDYVDQLLTCCSHDYILFFTNKGQMRWLKAYEIPEGTRDSQGKALVNLLELGEGEKIRAMIAVPEVDQPGVFVVMATRNGVVKKTPLVAFKNLRKKGIIAISLDEGDDLIGAALTTGGQEILLSSASGRACRFCETDIRPMGRTARGVRGMSIRAGVDELVSMAIVSDSDELLVVTANGNGKRTPVGYAGPLPQVVPAAVSDDDSSGDENAPDEPDGDGDEADEQGDLGEEQEISSSLRYRRTRRGSKGVTSIKLRAGDSVVAAMKIAENSEKELLLVSINGQMVRLRVPEVRRTGRAAYGVIIMRLSGDDKIASATIIDELSAEEKAANQAKAEDDRKMADLTRAFQSQQAAEQAKLEDQDDDSATMDGGDGEDAGQNTPENEA